LESDETSMPGPIAEAGPVTVSDDDERNGDAIGDAGGTTTRTGDPAAAARCLPSSSSSACMNSGGTGGACTVRKASMSGNASWMADANARSELPEPVDADVESEAGDTRCE
jgi:hypothetical protein